MRLRPSGSLGCAATLAALFAPAATAGPDDGERAWRTPDGRPDPWGVRDFRNLTPFGRSEPLAGQDVFSAEETARSTAERLAALDKDRRGPDVRIPPSGGCNDFWRNCGRQLTDDPRMSLVVDDPGSFKRPRSVAVPMRKNDLPVFEYACHEENYGILLMNPRAGTVRKAAAEGGRR